jgi:crotonobetainyl-CoA:carnitine CoA-transferase CaiB-like acyl-CoA transferase
VATHDKQTRDNPPGPLSDLRVLDLSRVLAGPWCTQNLADMGADVIKIEQPGKGDDTRHWGPPFFKDADGNDTPDACYFACANRNKRSVTVNLASAEGQDIIRKLAQQSDVVVENFKTGGLKRYGLDYGRLSPLNPRLIYCSITGFGQTGPYAPRAGYDLLMQAMTGLKSVTGNADGEPGARPLRVGVALTDVTTGMYATTAILCALEARHKTGRGQHIDVALFDVGLAMLANQASGYLNAGCVPGRQGNAHPSVAPYQDFPTKDGNMLLAIANDGQFTRFCAVVGKPWDQDPRFVTNTDRVLNRPALIPMMEAITRTRTTADWIATLEQHAVPCGPINNIDQAFHEPQAFARGSRIEQERYPGRQPPPGDVINRVATVASPLRLSANPVALRYAPPALGQHTDDVLREKLGLNAIDIAHLRAQGAL